ncbi:MAG: hypothetical protein FWC65_05780 [Treponema sp.]|nr:hypothetical protein [Treponema sp.]
MKNYKIFAARRRRAANAHPALFLFPLALLLGSCFGLDADIALNPDGSGTIALEYRVSKALDSLGRLDGNERWSTIPVGRVDFQRTLDRLPEMRLLSFSSREDDQDIIISARLEFSSIQGLLAFLDAAGSRAAFSGSAGSGRMAFALSEASPVTDAALADLLAQASEGYAVRIGFSLPSEGSLAVQDRRGSPLEAVPGAAIQAAGRRVWASFPLREVLMAPEGLALVFNW